MKIKYLFYALAIIISSFTVSAQSKVGTININSIVSNLPEINDVKNGIQNYEKKLQSDLKIKLDTYALEVEKANKAFANMTEVAKKAKQEEIYNLEADINKFRQNASQLVQLKQEELMRPLYKKVGDIVSVIAKEEKFTQVFTLDGNELAYFDPLFDITNKVASKLGVSID